jgi:D-alanyl-D-alanine carboxypeptidase
MINITKNNKRLFANFNNQSLFLIEPIEKNKFENIWEGNKIEFMSNNEMIFQENGNTFNFFKQ